MAKRFIRAAIAFVSLVFPGAFLVAFLASPAPATTFVMDPPVLAANSSSAFHSFAPVP
jgi:hypothetical protein